MPIKLSRRTIVSLSAAGFVAVAAYEGYRESAYIPVPGDVPTIGFGTTARVKLGDTVTPVAALGMALEDVQKLEAALQNDCINAAVYQHEYDAFFSLAYNVGAGAFCKSTDRKSVV